MTLTPAREAYRFTFGHLVGPPQYRMIDCARCLQKKGIQWTHGKRRYCNGCQPLAAKDGVAAIRAVRQAIMLGDLPHPKRLSCVDCGLPAKAYDHRDYSKPLDVQPVCKGCNVRRGPAIRASK